MKCDLESDESYVLANPRRPSKEHLLHEELLSSSNLKGVIWFATSGSTASRGEQKWAALSKKALLTSAATVNSYLASDQKDIWVSPLPLFHVGGFGIYARAHLSRALYYDLYSEKWDPERYYHALVDLSATLTSLVPTQLYDLVQKKRRAPPKLRAAIIGGAKLSEELYLKGISLGWPLLPSYGMTECSSQIATAHPDGWKFQDGSLHLLPHVEVRVNEEGYLQIQSPSLLSAYAFVGEEVRFSDPLEEGWLTSEDRVEIKGRVINVSGRGSDWIKIGGESSNIVALQEIWEGCCACAGCDCESVLIGLPDSRLGYVIVIIIASDNPFALQSAQELYNDRVMPYERIREIKKIEIIPRTPLGKIAKKELFDILKVNF